MKIMQDRVAEITTLHLELVRLFEKSLKKATRIGQLLTEQKASLEHGEWTPWIRENLPFSPRHAQRYMLLYAHKETLNTTQMSYLSINEAIKLIKYKPNGNGHVRAVEKSNSEKEPKNKILEDYEINEGLTEEFHTWFKNGRKRILANRALGEAVNWKVVSNFLLNLSNTLDELKTA